MTPSSLSLMDLIEGPGDNGATITARLKNEDFRLRSYQAEMVEESLKANIIVAMDTGSGKTHIALARTAAELETCHPDKLVWFLTPTVPLCEQQYQVFKSKFPGYGIQVLSGKDEVDYWTEQSWDAVLNNVRIVLSTHQVLLDALTHAFVKMSKLALLIFDEAHHCTEKHPANKIMEQFYMPLVKQLHPCELPRILGLSASPVMKASVTGNDLQKIERNLNATAKTPKLHRSELLQYVHKPQLIRVSYPVMAPTLDSSCLVMALENVFTSYDIMADPYVVDLFRQRNEGYDTSSQLQKVFVSGSTYCYQQLKTLRNKVKDMVEELGISPTDWYLHQCMCQFETMIRASDSQLFDWSTDERQHLLKILRRLPFSTVSSLGSISLENVSPKVETLVDLLVAEARPDFTGLIFVEQRVWVAILAEILTTHPRTRDLFNIGTFVGTSQSTRRKINIASFFEPTNQQNTLNDFRAGDINLILTTSVLEEGIDISSCHLVICFERPKNLKSFVQRRGRARKQQSKYFIFTPNVGGGQSPQTWESLEEEMKKAYSSDIRQVKEAEERELASECGERHFQVLRTGALLTLDNASQHLHHFCSLLGSSPYVDPRPQFKFEEKNGRISAEVMLPISVNPAIRMARSLETWATERMAKNDAAFEAYKALHLGGLVNDNLIPSGRDMDHQAIEFQIPDHTPSLVEVSPTFDPWLTVARYQQKNPSVYYRTLLTLRSPSEEPFSMINLAPRPMPALPEFTLYWNKSKRYSIQSISLPSIVLTEEEISIIRSITRRILQSVFSRRMNEERCDFLWLFIPCNESGMWNRSELEAWNTSVSGQSPALHLIQNGHHDPAQWGLVSLQGHPRNYILKMLDLPTVDLSLEPQLQVIRAPKRRDFLHPVAETNNGNDSYTRTEWLNASDCLVENLPLSYSIFALFIPSIVSRFEVFMVANELRTTLLKPVSFDISDNPILVRALTSSATGEEDNYQRLEFLGDCILKFIASADLMGDNLTWPESFLTGKKSKIVSNGSLARAAMEAGLDEFVITKRFTGAKWAPRYTTDVLSIGGSAEKIERSSKLIADIIESLIGTSYVVGGFTKAFACVQTLLPLEKWIPIPKANDILYEAAPTDVEITGLSTLERLIGYSFSKKMLLLESLTHASYTGPHANSSYERLEFIGDAILDYIISKRLYAHQPDLSHQKMHSMRTSMANAAFLAFRMFETKIAEERIVPPSMQLEIHYRALWQFLRSGNRQLVSSRDIAVMQHEQSREQILAALEHDAKFPWHLLSLTDAPKFLSDIVESVIGAIYIDSHGDISACESFAERLGILSCLRRILRDDVDCLHPKERLGHLAVEKSVQYVRVVDEEEGGKDKGSKMYRVQVKIGEEKIGGVVQGLKRLNAETIAAWKAVRILEGVDDVIIERSTTGIMRSKAVQ